MSNVSDEDLSKTFSISESESSAESSESFYLTAEDVEWYDGSLNLISTEKEIASYAEQKRKKRWRFSGEVDVGTWSVLLFSLLVLTIASSYLNLLTLRVRSREAIAGCSVALLPTVLLSTVGKLIPRLLECWYLSGKNALTVSYHAWWV